MRVGVNIIQFETFSMEWQQFNPSSVYDSLFTVCTKKTYSYVDVNFSIFFSDFTLIWSVGRISLKSTLSNFEEICAMGAEQIDLNAEKQT
jgi:hypothetical protein